MMTRLLLFHQTQDTTLRSTGDCEVGRVQAERLNTLPPYPQFREEVLGVDSRERWGQFALAKAMDGLPMDDTERAFFE